ncbi:hypothetical protein CF319_g8588 [Tilletia indica]|nr:hypothetical protein CF319_g8588 [Tilletia indica]
MWRELHSHQRPSSSVQASSSPMKPRPTVPTPARAVTSSSSITAAAPVVPSTPARTTPLPSSSTPAAGSVNASLSATYDPSRITAAADGRPLRDDVKLATDAAPATRSPVVHFGDAAVEETANVSVPHDPINATASTSSSSSMPTLHLARRAQFFHMGKTSFSRTERPLAHATVRKGKIVKSTVSSTTGTGTGYRSHLPITAHIRLNDTTSHSLTSLVDTGASLSIIDAKLLESLGGQPQGDGMWVHGLGNKQTLGWVTATVFIESKDSAGEIVHVECQQDFHVLSDFSPGLCLGLDFITTHRLTILPALGTASMGPYSFPVHEHVLGPYAKEPELRVADDVVAPPGCYVWIPVDASCLAPGVDYTVHPRLSVSEDDGVQLAGPAAVLTHKARRHILLGNFGTESRTLTRGTVIADATAAHLGDAVSEPGESFTLEAPLPTVFAATVPTEPADVATPVNPFEGTDGDGSDLTRDAATVVVDDHFRVGVGADGTPPAEIVDVLRRHRDAFALDGRPGRIRDGDEMTVELKPDAALRPEAPRRASPEKRKAMDAAIDQLLDWDVIEPSSSPVSFPVLMIRQYDKWRFCVDYRQLNAATVSDRYPLPTIDSIFQTLLGKTVFSSLDAIRGYHQMPVRESDRWKTAFVCHRGLYQYKTVPFGLKNAPAVFQRLMDRILGSLRWQHAVVYIDDIVIASRSLHEHAEALSTLLRTATAVGLRFSPGKCTFAVPSLVLLGRKISGAGVAVWADRAKAVGALQRPTTLKALYHVLGLFGYYRAFVPRFAEIAAPLSALTKGWRYEASADGRSRLINTEGRPVSADKEILDWGTAQQQSFDRLKAAIAQPPTLAHPDPARPYVLYVDASKDAFAAILHQVFEDPMAASPPTPTAAAMSMVPVQLLPPSIAKERWAAWLRSDRYFAPLMRDAESGAADSPWILEAGVLLRRTDGKLALPEAAVSEVMRSAHDGNGHFGFLKTYLAVSQSFWRPGLSVLVRAWVRHCAICQRTKRIPKVGSLDIEQDPQYPFNTISIDVLHGFPRTRSGNESVVAIHDVFSKMILLEPCSAGITAEGIAAIVSNRVLRFGWRPRRIVSDSEARVSGSVMTSLAESLHADLTPSPPHHQQANAVERAIQTVQQVLKALAVDGSAHWDRRLIPAIELAMNSTPSLVTGFRPFDLVFLSHPDAAHAVFDAEDHLGVSAFSERVAAAGERLHDARQATFAARTDQKRRYDRRRRPLAQLQPGDEVYVRLDDRPIPGLSVGKLDARKAGPYKVASVLSPHRVRLDLPADSKISDEFSVEQLDLAPRSPDPFEHARVPSPPAMLPSPPLRPSVGPSSSDADVESLPADLEVVGSRSRQLPVGLRDFQLGVARASSSDSLADALRGPVYRTRTLEVDGVSITLRERPVVFLSRLTSVTEQRMVAPELELCCLAWAFARLAHLLEGAEVTVVTDHAPLGPMLTSTSGIPYGPTITRCRALLMPHLHNLRFVHRAGSTHTNADALSRLPPAI